MIAFWAIAILLAAAILLVLARTALGAGRVEAPARKDIEIYKAQLAEVERDLERGVVSEADAEALRTEIARRLLAADAEAADAGQDAQRAPLWGTVALGAGALAGAFALYFTLGAPGYGDMPLASRLAALEDRAATRPSQAVAQRAYLATAPRPDVDPSFEALVADLRAAVAERPEELEGLALLARNEAALGNYAAAIAAQEALIAAKGQTDAADHRDLAELMIVATGFYVSPEAETELRIALSMDPNDGAALYFLGLMFQQAGRYDRTFALWQPLLEGSPPSAPWVPLIRGQIPAIASLAGIRYVLPEGRGPTVEDLAAAEEMSLEDRAAMIEGMVQGLADRLATQGGPPEDWAQLIVAQAVLGQQERAQAILDEAREVFQDRADALNLFQRVAADQGLR
ncbi:MAG: c-type cytochrome biogenesis protein CcmI [Pseudomonadota bacterium]